MPRLPNLFQGAQRTASAQRLYEMFLSRLHFAGFNDRTLSACREIRRYAGTAGRKRVGEFTYFWELQAYGDKQDFESMWRVLEGPGTSIAWKTDSLEQPSVDTPRAQPTDL